VIEETVAERQRRVRHLYEAYGKPERISTDDKGAQLLLTFRYRNMEAYIAYKNSNAQYGIGTVTQVEHHIEPDGHVIGTIAVRA
jgi:hypothetical protein